MSAQRTEFSLHWSYSHQSKGLITCSLSFCYFCFLTSGPFSPKWFPWWSLNSIGSELSCSLGKKQNLLDVNYLELHEDNLSQVGKKPKEAEGLAGRGLGLFEVILERLESIFSYRKYCRHCGAGRTDGMRSSVWLPQGFYEIQRRNNLDSDG